MVRVEESTNRIFRIHMRALKYVPELKESLEAIRLGMVAEQLGVISRQLDSAGNNCSPFNVSIHG